MGLRDGIPGIRKRKKEREENKLKTAYLNNRHLITKLFSGTKTVQSCKGIRGYTELRTAGIIETKRIGSGEESHLIYKIRQDELTRAALLAKE